MPEQDGERDREAEQAQLDVADPDARRGHDGRRGRLEDALEVARREARREARGADGREAEQLVRPVRVGRRVGRVGGRDGSDLNDPDAEGQEQEREPLLVREGALEEKDAAQRGGGNLATDRLKSARAKYDEE